MKYSKKQIRKEKITKYAQKEENGIKDFAT
jgi:hypothetical protein